MEKIKLPWLTAAVILVVTCAAIPPAKAAGFSNLAGTCYSWAGGDKSSGAFNKCDEPWVVAQARPAPVIPAPLAAAPTPAATIVPMAYTPVPKVIKRVVKKRRAAQKC